MKWHVDGSHNTHWDCKGHGGAMFAMGKGATSSYLRKVKLNTKSSTETELVVSDMYMPEMLWLLHFIEAQGYDVECVGLYQDNISTQMLIRNGQFSSGWKTKHVKAKFFFIKDRVDKGEIKVIDCPAEEMWADILTKPPQGAKFRQMRAFLMNCPIDYHEPELMTLPTAAPTLSPTRIPHPQISSTVHLPQDEPTDHPTKPRCPRPDPLSRGCVETRSPDTNVSHPSRTTYKPTDKIVSWRESLFPRHTKTSS